MVPWAQDPVSVQRAVVTVEELNAHNKKGDLWIAIEGVVYDLTKWAAHHPGGEHLLVNMAGQDATGVYRAFHTKHGTGYKADKLLTMLPKVATLAKRPRSQLETDFRALQERVEKEGMFETRYSFFYGLAAWLAALFVLQLYLTLNATTMWGTLLAAAAYALFVQQCAFVGHDTAHNGITHNRAYDIMIGNIVGPLATGISTAWWKHSHNAHHVVTNSVTHDPDIQHMPVFAVTENLFNKGGVWSYYHRRFFHFDAPAKFILSHQHLLYYPIMSFARFNLYVQSWLRLFNYESKIDFRYFEMCMMLAWTCWFSLMVYQLPTLGMRVAFILASHMLAGILHVQITISHFSMPTYSGPNHAESQKMGENEAFLRQQVHTSMDLTSGWRNDWFYGGLQWQVVHHVFPRLPRHNLPIVRLWLIDLCAMHGLNYKSVGWVEGNKEIIRTLKKAAIVAQKCKVASFEDSLLWAGLNAEG
mmetsp:Transcript_5572/g.12365  ORF Transcript_5572/g.12365 Transcript_5572/m.12365 type:complete len:473 (+) Transcript_5572:105-1523(+)|eukprot:CAMPEP_0180138206 /NCGR_PEP_ID=MMETSP0986-20121125/12725_1 /TAXON_ID=697907 /ORGANISM="non described non described, Strain CCMP2293" /LENGTH=472 /DNA_ID=CAMNT_0022079925 /DNA_START=96 /DNA_END=1514 /DNA_ORIENTATION=+